MQKEAFMASFETLAWHSPVGTKENQGKPQSDDLVSQTDSNRGPPKYKKEVLLHQPTFSVYTVS
jgi:hypothetical protein